MSLVQEMCYTSEVLIRCWKDYSSILDLDDNILITTHYPLHTNDPTVIMYTRVMADKAVDGI
jgi:hypothetical protein